MMMTKFCVWVVTQDVITYATFGDDLLRVLGVAVGRISHFPIDLGRRSYNTRTTVRVCDVYCLGYMQWYLFRGYIVEHSCWTQSTSRNLSLVYISYCVIVGGWGTAAKHHLHEPIMNQQSINQRLFNSQHFRTTWVS